MSAKSSTAAPAAKATKAPRSRAAAAPKGPAFLADGSGIGSGVAASVHTVGGGSSRQPTLSAVLAAAAAGKSAGGENAASAAAAAAAANTAPGRARVVACSALASGVRVKLSDGATETLPRAALIEVRALRVAGSDPLLAAKTMLQDDARAARCLPPLLLGTTLVRGGAAGRFTLEPPPPAQAAAECDKVLAAAGRGGCPKAHAALMELYATLVQRQGFRESIAAELAQAPAAATVDPRDLTRIAAAIESYEEFQRDPYSCVEACGAGRVPFAALDTCARAFHVSDAVCCERFVEHCLKQLMADDGHTCVERGLLSRVAAHKSEGRYTAEQALRAIDASSVLVTVAGGAGGATRYVYTRQMHKMEAFVAERVQALVERGLDREGADHAKELAAARRVMGGLERPLSAKQRQAVEQVFTTADILLLSGYPGTGKSSVVACVQRVCEELGLAYAVMAPTGKAANRLGEGATTVHRALEACVVGQRGEFRFARGPSNPLQLDLVILDEASMLDAWLAYHLFRALDPKRTRLLILGDPDQLPPVDAGCFLRALLDSSVVPAVRLTKIFRQDEQSDICCLARAITRGSAPAPAELRAMRGVVWVEGLSHSAPDVQARLIELYKKHDGRLQVLIPAKRGGQGTQEVNAALHGALFPVSLSSAAARGSAGFGGGVAGFEPGDKVVCIRNCYHRDEEGNVVPEMSVFNGDTGVYVAPVRSGRATLHRVQFGRASDRDVPPLEPDALDFGYALTVHKAQGSEYDAVALVLHASHGQALNRELLYTAVTRAKGLLYVIAPYECIARCAATPCAKRVSLLSELVAAGFEVVGKN